MSEIKEIKAAVYYHDHGDGGGSHTIYPTMEDLKAGYLERFEYDELSEEELEQKWNELINENDPYENGEVSETTIKVEVSEDGSVKLAKSIYVSWGQ